MKVWVAFGCQQERIKKMANDTFLSADELVILTGRKVKSKQVDALRRMGVPFFVNACGRAVVARSSVEGRKEVRAASGWTPRVIGV
jgi:biotin operon repressor